MSGKLEKIVFQQSFTMYNVYHFVYTHNIKHLHNL